MRSLPIGERPGPRICSWLVCIAGLGAVLASASAGAASGLGGNDGAGKGPGIHGRVFALDETGDLKGTIPGATIEFKNAAGQAVAKVTTNEHGYYKLDLAAGTYLYKVQAAGFKDEDFGRGRQLVLSQGYAIYNFSLVKGKTDSKQKPPVIVPVELGKLQGHVFEKTADGKLLGIAGAAITLVNRKSIGQPVRVVTQNGDTNERGRYEVTLEAATYHASVRAAGFARLDDPQPIQVETGKTATRDFILSRVKPPTVPDTQGIKGTITLLKPRNGVAKQPAITVWIVALRGQQSTVKLTPDAKGKYAEKLTTGLYQVVAEADGYRPASSGPRQVYAGRFTIVDLRLRPLPPAITPELQDIHVLAKVFQKEPDGSQGPPLPGTSVLFRPEGKPATEKSRGTTDANGQASLTLPAGTYDAIAYKVGFTPQARKATVQAGTPQTYVFLLEPAKAPTPVAKAKITFNVVQRDIEFGSTPLAGADIEVTQQNRAVAGGQTSSAGTFATGLLLPGTYDVVVTRAGFMPARLQVTLANTDIRRDVLLKTIPAKLTTEGRLHLWVVEAPATAGKGLAGARLRVRQMGTSVAGGTTEPDGKYTFALKYGTYTIDVARAGYRPRTVEIALNQPEVRQTIALVPADVAPPVITALKLHVKVIDASPSAQPIPAAEVFAVRQDKTQLMQQTGHDGQTTFSLKPGTYTIVARKPQYRLAQAQVVLDAKDQYLSIQLAQLAIPLPTAAQLHVRALDEQRRPLGGAQAIVQRDQTTIDSAYTAADGQATFRLKPGTYTVTVSKAGFTSARVEVAMAQRDISRTILLRSTVEQKAWLQLQVLAQPNRLRPNVPLADADVQVRWGGQIVGQGRTDSAGRFSRELRRDLYQVVIAKAGYEPAQLTMDLRQGNVHREVVLSARGGPIVPVVPIIPKIDNIVPPPAKKVSLTMRIVETSTGKMTRVAGASVMLQQGGRTVVQGSSNATGTFFAGNLSAGSYRIIVTKVGFHTVQVDTSITEDVVRSVTLQRSVTIR